MNSAPTQQNRVEVAIELPSFKEELDELLEKQLLIQKLIEESVIDAYRVNLQIESVIEKYKEYVTMKELS